MIPLFLTKQPIVKTIPIDGLIFRVAGSADLEHRIIQVNVSADPNQEITDVDIAKIQRALSREWNGYTVVITYHKSQITY